MVVSHGADDGAGIHAVRETVWWKIGAFVLIAWVVLRREKT